MGSEENKMEKATTLYLGSSISPPSSFELLSHPPLPLCNINNYIGCPAKNSSPLMVLNHGDVSRMIEES